MAFASGGGGGGGDWGAGVVRLVQLQEDGKDVNTLTIEQ